MAAPAKKTSEPPMITRREIQRYAYSLENVWLPKKMIDKLIEIYAVGIVDLGDNHWVEYTEQDVHEQVRKYIMQYAELKRKLDVVINGQLRF
jgi:hypothetical protein